MVDPGGPRHIEHASCRPCSRFPGQRRAGRDGLFRARPCSPRRMGQAFDHPIDTRLAEVDRWRLRQDEGEQGALAREGDREPAGARTRRTVRRVNAARTGRRPRPREVRRLSLRAARPFAVLFLFFISALLCTPDARADEPEDPEDRGEPDTPVPKPPAPDEKPQHDYTTERLEPAGFPIIGGDSDIGFQFGGVGTLSYFKDGVKPYRWSMNLVLSSSVKSGPTGAEIAQQNYLWLMDVPEFLGEGSASTRRSPTAHTVNYGYFGFGNASSGTTPPDSPEPRPLPRVDRAVRAGAAARAHSHPRAALRRGHGAVPATSRRSRTRAASSRRTWRRRRPASRPSTARRR